MNTPLLKIYYELLIVSNPQKRQWWHDAYQNFSEEILVIKKQLIEGKSLSNKETFESLSYELDVFLKKLIYEKSNGIASRGQSVISHANFKKLIADEPFKEALSSLIQTPDFKSFSNLKEAWNNADVGNNPLLRNRVLAACTNSVTTTVNELAFNQVFWWLVDQNLIIEPGRGIPLDWFHLNKHLVNQLEIAFKEELVSGRYKKRTIDKYWLSIFVWELYENITNSFSLKKQVVYYGAPGTGKTYKAKQNCDIQFKLWKAKFGGNVDANDEEHITTLQFHPSYGYEDFIEGIRPVLNKKGKSELKLANGIFKEICKTAAQWELDFIDKYPQMTKNWGKLTIRELKELDNFKALIAETELWRNIILCPNEVKVSEAVPPYFVIIDEINRAELSRVFGELMIALEYRGSEGRVKTQCASLNDNTTGLLKVGNSYEFFVPENVFIIGTMNTVDRSVESFDFALRRRFRWEEIAPDPSVVEHYYRDSEQPKRAVLAQSMEALNKQIRKEPLLGPDYCIGHAYFIKLSYPEGLDIKEIRTCLWEDAVCPLLTEYLRGTGRTDDLLKNFNELFFNPKSEEK